MIKILSLRRITRFPLMNPEVSANTGFVPDCGHRQKITTPVHGKFTNNEQHGK
jgi:hypothetical protein